MGLIGCRGHALGRRDVPRGGSRRDRGCRRPRRSWAVGSRFGPGRCPSRPEREARLVLKIIVLARLRLSQSRSSRNGRPGRGRTYSTRWRRRKAATLQATQWTPPRRLAVRDWRTRRRVAGVDANHPGEPTGGQPTDPPPTHERTQPPIRLHPTSHSEGSGNTRRWSNRSRYPLHGPTHVLIPHSQRLGDFGHTTTKIAHAYDLRITPVRPHSLHHRYPGNADEYRRQCDGGDPPQNLHV